MAAGTAPSGANHQPWHFVCVGDAELKRKIRIAAEHEEEEFYGGRAGESWLEDLDKLGTDANKPFLETATLADRYIFTTQRHRRVGQQTKELLHVRVCWDCNRISVERTAQRRACNFDSHTQPDEVSQ